MKKKISSRGRKNDAVYWDELKPMSKAEQLKIAVREIKRWSKVVNSLSNKHYCLFCKCDFK